MWKLTIEDDQTNKTVVHLVRDEYGLGRAEENAIRLTERNISRLHAQLERKSEHWALRDLSSYNGCYVNGQRVAGSQELNHGDVIQVGDYRLALENEALLVNEQDATATVPAPRTASPSSSVDRLVMIMGPSPGAEFELTQDRMVIGRGEDCDIALNHASVSRIHAELHPLGDGRYEILDRQSANGVRVNGVELPRSFVDARDVIELGDVILKFIPAGQMYTPGADESLQIAAIGAARRQEAEESGIGQALGRSSNLKWFVGLGVLFLAGVAAAVVLTQRSTPAEMVSMKDAATARAEQTLGAAKQLLANGDPRGAYAKSGEVPQGSALRDTSDFRQIQAAYADYLFAQADQASDAADKRALYDQIARAPTIDRGRRNRAAERLAALSSQAVDVKDLPNARPAPPIDEAQRARANAPAAASAEAAETEGEAPPAATPSPRAPTPRGERATPPPASSKGQTTTLVRESPF